MSLIQEAYRLSLNAVSKKHVARALGVSELTLERAIHEEHGVTYTNFKDQRLRICRLTRVKNLRMAELVEVRKLVQPCESSSEDQVMWISVYDDHSGVVHTQNQPTRYLTPSMMCGFSTERSNDIPHWLMMDLLTSARRYHYDDYVKLTTSTMSLDGLQRMVIPAPTVHEGLDYVVTYLKSLGLPIALEDLKPAIPEHAAINLVAAEGGRWTGRARVFLTRR